jgi:hypothetical protein
VRAIGIPKKWQREELTQMLNWWVRPAAIGIDMTAEMIERTRLDFVPAEWTGLKEVEVPLNRGVISPRQPHALNAQ